MMQIPESRTIKEQEKNERFVILGKLSGLIDSLVVPKMRNYLSEVICASR